MSKKYEIGDYVKVVHSGERFWLIVEGQTDDGYLGKVNNNLIVAPFKFGDSIGFREEEVIQHLRKEDLPE